jgi:uncharacterized membrane protein YdfJ with MMPL/SSD domain
MKEYRHFLARIDMGLLDSFYRLAEPAAGVVSGAAAQPIAGVAGILKGGDAPTVNKLLQALTYEPRTQAGQEGQNALRKLLMEGKSAMVDNNPPVRYFVDSYNELADDLGKFSPVLGAAMRTAPVAAGLLSTGPVRGAISSAGRSLAPNAEQMVRSYAAKTGIEHYILPPDVFKALIDKQRSGPNR